MKAILLGNMFVFSCLAAMVACTEKHNSQDKGDVKTEAPDMVAEVDTLTLRMVPFTSDVVSNGRVKASESSDVFFRASELIDEVYVHNGQRVRKGEPLARLDMFKLNAEKVKQEALLDQSSLEMKDVLIGQGYNPEDESQIPPEVMRLARVRSGLEQAETSYSATLKDLEHATLTAPFEGVVANVNGTRHSMASMSEPFCRIINDHGMSVEFPVLESELPMIGVGEAVEIIPYNGGAKYQGLITEINPMIDDNGHVRVKAKLNDSRGLIDGMNVKIRSYHNLGKRLVVPKSAVVLRTGRQVAFTYDNGKAMWNYVTTGLENFDSYEITEGLTEGASLIVSGNENLAHESPVVVGK